MKQKTKIIVIDGTSYQLARFRAAVGSYLLQRIMAAGVSDETPSETRVQTSEQKPKETPKPEEIARMVVFGSFGKLDFETHKFVQLESLKVCSRMENDLPMPLVGNGQIVATIADDLPLIMRLQTEALVFNFTDFFVSGGLSALADQDQNSPRT